MTGAGAAVPGPDDVERFRVEIAERLGLQFDDTRTQELTTLLGHRLRETGDRDLDAYRKRLADPAELGWMAERLTTGETYLFRSEAHFRVLDDILRASEPGQPIRVLSAGCSTGEEAYTIAIRVHETLPAWAHSGVSIHAVDVNPAALAKAQAGRYSSWSLRETPTATRERWFRPAGRAFQLAPEIRTMVAFEAGNLVDPRAAFWQRGPYHVVFCRNVLMYFAPTTQRAVIAALAAAVHPGGALFLGHAETLRGLSDSFQLRHADGAFFYERGGGGALVRPAPVRDGSLSSSASPALSRDWPAAIEASAARVTALEERVRVGRGGHADLLPSPGLDISHLAAPASAEEDDAAAEHYMTALRLDHADDHASAIRHYRAASALDPGFALPHFHLGRLARRAGHLRTARRELAEALAKFAVEDVARITRFGGGFSQEALIRLCRSELSACGDE